MWIAGAGGLAIAALTDDANMTAATLGLIALFVASRIVLDCGVTMRAVRHGLHACGLLAKSTAASTVVATQGP